MVAPLLKLFLINNLAVFMQQRPFSLYLMVNENQTKLFKISALIQCVK